MNIWKIRQPFCTIATRKIFTSLEREREKKVLRINELLAGEGGEVKKGILDEERFSFVTRKKSMKSEHLNRSQQSKSPEKQASGKGFQRS